MYIDPALIRDKMREHIVGPTGSVLLHILLVILLIKFAVINIYQPDLADIVAIQTELPIKEIEEPPIFEEAPVVEDDDIPMAQAAEEQPDLAPPEPAPLDGDRILDPFDALTIDNNFSPVFIKNLRIRQTKIGMHTYNPGVKGDAILGAIDHTLRWLQAHQLADGSWGKGNDKHVVGLSSLALLTYLAHGETQHSERYGKTIDKAIRYLIGKQQKDGTIGPKGYAHGIATYALCEVYALTKAPALRQSMQDAVASLIEGQGDHGGWNYGYNSTERIDLSVSGWQIQALKAAAMAGYQDREDIATLQTCMDKAMANLQAFQTKNGQFAYARQRSEQGAFAKPNGGRLSMTGVGVLGLQMLGQGRSSPARHGLQVLAQACCDWDQGWGKGLHSCPTYAWYYITQAKFHASRNIFDHWNKQFRDVFLERQHQEGYWDSPTNFAIPDPQLTPETLNHRVYNTTLSALTLMVYIRHLPSYKKLEDADWSDDSLLQPAPKEIEIELIPI